MKHACRLAAVSMVLIAGAAVALPPGQYDYVIVTTADLAGEFQALADFKNDLGIATTVVTLDWVVANAEAGVDLPETIRHFLQVAADE
jgi:hypothetical protein